MDVDEDQQMDSYNNENTDTNTDTNKKVHMECDLSAYVLFHEGNTGAPCLSFDILPDELGRERNCDTPTTCYFIAGSQASKAHLNSIVLMKMKNLMKVIPEEDDDSEIDSNDEDDDDVNDPKISSVSVSHKGCINRIRATKYNDVQLAASWSELGQVNIWDLTEMLRAVESATKSTTLDIFPSYTFSGHKDEGFAIDWSSAMAGTLATGDCSNNIHVWTPEEGGQWSVNAKSLRGHTASVEDLQWSPNEPYVLASCSVDKSIRIWDTRDAPNRACKLTCANAHDSDVNVIHWNRNEPFIASGGDDSKVLIWDLRKFESNSPVGHLQYHSSPVCTVEWHPTEGSVLASGGEDNKILQWDLAVEKDAEQDKDKKEEEDSPEQLLFVHEGQTEVKEVHWHPQVPGMIISTAHSGFNVFKTISC